MTRWALVLLGLAGAGLATFLALGRGRPEVVFSTAAAARQDLQDCVMANGEVQARTRVNVGTSVTSEIKRLHVVDGQWVKAGDLLVTLDQERARQELSQAELGLSMIAHDLEKAAAAWRQGQETWRRAEKLFQAQLISLEQHQAARLAQEARAADHRRLQAAVEQSRAQAAVSRDALAKTVLRAPIEGRVTGLRAEQGETAVAGQTNVAGAVLMVISRMDEMLAEVKVGELDVVKLKPGQPAEVQVDAWPGRVFPGRVLEVATSVDAVPGQGMDCFSQQTQNYRVRIRIQAEPADLDGLRPGMSARVAVLATEKPRTLAIPLQAIQDREARPGALGLITGSQPVVFVVKDGLAEERPLRLGLCTRQAAEILEGLREGEQILTGPARELAALVSGARTRTGGAGPGRP